MAEHLIAQGIPRATFAKLSPHPYLLSSLQPQTAESSAAQTTPSIRSNGRPPQQARPPGVTFGSLSYAHGSAVVRVGDSTAICGVRGETILTDNIPNYRRRQLQLDSDVERTDEELAQDRDLDAAELRDYDLLVPNIELATGSCPQFLPGVPPTQLAQTLSTRVYSLLHTSRLINMDDLRIWREVDAAEEAGDAVDEDDEMDGGEVSPPQGTKRREVVAFWVLYIDIFFISFDGNGFDVSWAALLAALRDTRLPSAYWDLDREMILCDPDEPFRPLATNGLPIACTVAVFVESGENSQKGDDRASGTDKFWVLVDPDTAEEKICTESATVVVDKSAKAGAQAETRILAMEKTGGARLDEDLLGQLMGVAEKRWEQWEAVLTPDSQ